MGYFTGIATLVLIVCGNNLMINDKNLLTDVKNHVIVYLTINIKKLFNIVLSLARIIK